ncbi:MAG TPA: aspartyl/glutamyl-tRNA amidotransferase subunit C [Anaerolineae bacterium]|nr:aspartyl/glutamyl-tRNA amidotransferase subunit C [Anaerolineae bacterium]
MMLKEKTKKSQSITPETFAHLVKLAALELNKEQAEYLRKELNSQLNAICELEAIPMDTELPATSHGIPYTQEIKPALRNDKIVSCPNPQEIVAQTPESQDGYVIVPDIPQITLE